MSYLVDGRRRVTCPTFHAPWRPSMESKDLKLPCWIWGFTMTYSLKVVKIRGSHWAMPLTSGSAPLQVFEIEFGFFIFLSQSFRNTGNGLFHFLNKWMSDMVLFLYFFPGNMMPCRAPVLYIMFPGCPLISSSPSDLDGWDGYLASRHRESRTAVSLLSAEGPLGFCLLFLSGSVLRPTSCVLSRIP